MDVSICGAVAPYNELLGGKLVALLLASKEIREYYSERYSGQISDWQDVCRYRRSACRR
ncbi:MAG: Druantia anti-phage system protein DruA [Sphingorhabdus sp.]